MSKTIKVLHYGLSNNIGGIENVVLSWLNNLPNDVTFDFIYENDEPLVYQDVIDSKSTNIFRIPNRFTNPIKHYKSLKKIIEDNHYDFVHCHIMTMAEPFIALLLNRKNKYSIIFHCHSMYKNVAFSFKEKLLQLITKMLLIGKNYYKLACSRESGEFMFNSDFEVIENGINLNTFKFSNTLRKTMREKLNIIDDEILIGHVGHVCVEKNYPFLLSSFASLNNKRYKLLLIGNMINNEEINNLIEKYNIKDKVLFTGLIPNVKDYYSAMDVFYLPSLNEGFPVTLLEAQANGLACITSKSVTRDVKVSDDIAFIDFNNDDFKKNIEILLNKKTNRNNVSFNKKYDVVNSSKKVFDFYRNNLKTKQ